MNRIGDACKTQPLTVKVVWANTEASCPTTAAPGTRDDLRFMRAPLQPKPQHSPLRCPSDSDGTRGFSRHRGEGR